MNVIDKSEYRALDGTISFQNRLAGMFKYGPRWYGEMAAQATVTDRLNKTLHAEHTLIRNLPVPGTFHILPMILLSPQGVRVLMALPVGGVFRAKGEEWMRFDGGSRHFRRSRPNFQAEVTAHTRKVADLLREQGYELPEIESVLIFTNPRTHVDTARPHVRIVQADAIEHFAANLLQFPPIMNQEDIRVLVEALTKPKTTEPPPEAAEPPEPAVPVAPRAPQHTPAGAPPAPRPGARTGPLSRPAPPPETTFKSEPIGRRGQPSPAVAEILARPRPAAQEQEAAPAKRRRRGMPLWQWLLIALLFLAEVAVVALAAYLIYSGALPLPG
jgi:hypothetical protein